jgi:hypothetical protein
MVWRARTTVSAAAPVTGTSAHSCEGGITSRNEHIRKSSVLIGMHVLLKLLLLPGHGSGFLNFGAVGVVPNSLAGSMSNTPRWLNAMMLLYIA